MPLYNFTSEGDIYQYDNLIRTIDGPAAITPRAEADYFTLSYLSGSDIFYWDTNTFQIDGVTFEGTFTEFCTEAEALFATSGGGSGESYPDITSNTIINLSDGNVFSIADNSGTSLLYVEEGAGDRFAGIGDTAAAIITGPSSSIYSDITAGASTSAASMDAWYDNYTTYAANGVFIASGLAEVAIVAVNPAGSAGINLNSSGIVLSGMAVTLPKMTKAVRNAIVSPVSGMAVYQTDNTPGLRVYNGTNWMRFTETADA